jgi:predicted hydrolase (HD superfamily)
MPRITLDQARALMHEWTASEALRVHMECVAACMGAYARALEPAEVERWSVAGLLHDFDYERHPGQETHPFVGVAHLRERGLVDEEVLAAILGHAEYSGTPRESAMSKALFAVDELAGFIVACAKVRPDGIRTLEPGSVKKKLKDKRFAAAVNRADIDQGTTELGELAASRGLPFEPTSHLQTCIDAIRAEAGRLAL